MFMIELCVFHAPFCPGVNPNIRIQDWIKTRCQHHQFPSKSVNIPQDNSYIYKSGVSGRFSSLLLQPLQ